MGQFLRLGRVLFAVPMIVFGLQYVATGKYAGGLPPVAPWAPGGAVGAYLVGVILILLGTGIVVGFRARMSATILGLLFLLCAIVLHASHGAQIVQDGTERTRFLEPLALAGAAFVLAGLFGGKTSARGWETVTDGLATAGRYIFALSFVIFGLQHFQYEKFLVALVPGWMPWHLFLIRLTGAAMLAAGLAMTFNLLGRTAALGLAAMFGVFVVTLHIPRVLAAIHNQDELTSLFVALAFGGAALVLAESLANRKGSTPI